MYSLGTQRLSATEGSDQAKRLDTEIQKYGELIAKSREQASTLSDEAKQLSNLNKLGEERAKIIKQYQNALKESGNGETGLKQMTEEYKRLAEYIRNYNSAQKSGQDTSYWQERIEASKKLLSQQSEEIQKLDLTTERKQQLLTLEQKISDVLAKQNTGTGNAGAEQLAKAQKALAQMQAALSGIGRSYANKDMDGMKAWAKVGDEAKKTTDEVAEQLKKLQLSEEELAAIENTLHQVNDLYSKQGEMLDINGQFLDKIGTKLVEQTVTWTTNTLKNMFQDAISYASEYYDLMNEIRIVSGYSEEQAAKLSAEYRTLAKEMSVSSTDIAKAAVEFWRQGLDEDETNRRIKAATQYAKISSLEFSEAAELITAATNTLDISAQHVADVFAYLGDESASGADEIGVAMQKASASAQEFGVSFEWLGTYIATVSEKTRQAPEVIGTAFNSIMARMHSIKQKGFNEEDATQINDVAKALGTLGIELLDEQNSWRSMSDIMTEIAGKWDTLDDKQKGYISTTMAGTKQQNTFLALMNDMSKGAEGGSRAFELYKGAMNAAGTATQKYSVYMESVEAAQGRLKSSLESLYGLLSADWMKGAYDGLAGFVDLIAGGTESLKGLNLTIPATAAGLGTIVVVITKIVSLIREIKKVGLVTSLASASNPIGLIVTALAALVTVVTAVAGAIKKASEVKLPDYGEQLSTLKDYTGTISPLIDEYTKLAGKQNKTTNDTKRMDEIFAQLSGTSYTLQTKLEGLEGQYNSGSEAIRAMNEELREQMDLQNSISQLDAFGKFAEQVQAVKDAYAEMDKVDLQKNVLKHWGEYTQGLASPLDATKGGFEDYLQSKYVEYSSRGIDREANGMKAWAGQLYALADEYSDAFAYVDKLGGDISTEMMNLNTLVGANAEKAAAGISDAWNDIKQSLSTWGQDSSFLDAPAEITKNIDSFVNTIVESMRNSVDGNADLLTKQMLDNAAALIKNYKEAVKENLAGADMADVLPDNFKSALSAYSDELFAFLQKLYAQNPAAVTEELLSSVTEMFTVCRETLAKLASSPEFVKLMDEYNELLKAPEAVDYEGYKKIVDGINGYISEYNAQVESGEIEGAKIDLLPDYDEAEFAKWKETAVASVTAVGEAADAAAEKMGSFGKYYAEWLEKQKAADAAKNNYRDATSDILSKSMNADTKKFDVSLFKTAMDEAHAANADLVEEMTKAYPMLGDIYASLIKEADAYSYLKGIINGTTVAYAEERSEMAENLKAQEALAKAKEAGFADQVGALDKAFTEGQMPTFSNGVMGLSGGLENARKEFNTWSSDMQESFAQTYPELYNILAGTVEVTDETKAWAEALARVYEMLANISSDSKEDFFKEQTEYAKNERLNAEAQTAADNNYSGQFNDLAGVFMDSANLEDKAEAIEMLREKIYEMYTENATLAEGFREEYGNFWNVLFDPDSGWEDIVSAYLDALEQCRGSLQETADALYEAANGTAEYNTALASIQEALDTGSEEAFIAVWNSLGKTMQEALLKGSDAIKDYVTSLSGMSEAHEDALDAAKKLTREGLTKEGTQLAKQNKIWEEAVDVISDSGKSQAEYLKSISGIGTKLNDLALAQADLATAMDTTQAGTDAYNTALENLANYCGFAINSEYDLAMAAALLSGDTDMATSSMEWLISSMLSLTGISLDPSTWISQLQALAAQGDETAAAILGLIEQLASVNGATVSLDKNGKVNVSGLGSVKNGKRSSSSSRRSGGGGGSSRRSSPSSSYGGGGGSSGNSGPTEIERFLDIIGQIQTIQNHKKAIIELEKAYFESRGEIQGVLKCIEYEKQAIQANSDTLQANLAKIESLMEAKRAEVNLMDTSAEGYAEAADDLKSLQDRHMEYSKQLKQNRNDLEALNKEIKEWKNKIRQMEIDLRNTILSAIEDREELKERMLQGTINTENAILDIIKARYEKERDEILDTADAKKDALEEEKKALQEQLNARKEAQQEEEKLIELKKLEAKLARISADSTRRKEALELQKQIKDLRDEIAWDTAEKEVEAQQEAIDQQITSTEEYADYIKKYYEDLLENPRNFIAEVQKIMSQSDEEILQWLKENSEEYKNSTDATRTDITNGWQDMLNDMRGAIVTYWDEIEDIISKGDDAIIQFLMDNSADYKAAGKLQAEAYVDAWKEQLENLKNAYKDVAVDISSYDYQPVIPASGSGGSDYGGYDNTPSTPSGSNPRPNKNYTPKPKTQWRFTFNGQLYSGYSSSSAAKAAAKSVAQQWLQVQLRAAGGAAGQAQARAQYNTMLNSALLSVKSYGGSASGNATSAVGGAMDVLSRLKSGTSRYASGGISTKTGLAWLDGTPSKPERVLSPYQTQLFEDMIGTLHAIKTINVPTMPAFGAETSSRSQPTLTFGDVVIQVDKLDNDTDYDELAEKFFDRVLEKSGRVQSVGGIRLSK